jgi:hypothetical protein
MSKSGPLTQADWDAIRAKQAAMTPEEARAWIRAVVGPPRRQLLGDEYKHMMMVLGLKDPICSSNNQRFWTDEYEHGGRRYEITYGVEDEPILNEVGD